MTYRSSRKKKPTSAAQRPDRRREHIYFCEADILEGLEQIGRAELRERLGSAVVFGADTREGTIRFSYNGALRRLLDLRSFVAVYLVHTFAVPRPRALLGHQHLTALHELLATARALFPKDAFRTLRLSAAGQDSTVMSRLKAELAQGSGLESVADDADMLLRLRPSMHGTGWEALVRLSPRPLATRNWRVCNRPGALNATLAYAMMRLSEPRSTDRFVNLACGSGTLLVERLALGPAQLVIGCDVDTEALECARENLRAAGYERLARLERWDAAHLPLGDNSVSVICADLPFGQLVGSHRENELLYPRILAEAARIAAHGARMVLLTHEVRLLERIAAEQVSAWRLDNVLRVRSGGMTPRVYLLRRL
jgi:23S rRNA G2445 N2-methylase RlmL